mgnify:CR=1 FL=1
MSLLNEVVLPKGGDDWSYAYAVLEHLAALNASTPIRYVAQREIAEAIPAVAAVRSIVRDLLTDDHWSEYFVALTFAGLRAMQWTNLTLSARRLMFLVAALSIYELGKRSQAGGASETPSETEFTDGSS